MLAIKKRDQIEKHSLTTKIIIKFVSNKTRRLKYMNTTQYLSIYKNLIRVELKITFNYIVL